MNRYVRVAVVLAVIALISFASYEYVETENSTPPSQNLHVYLIFEKQNYSGKSFIQGYVNVTFNGSPEFKIATLDTPFLGFSLVYVGNSTKSLSTNITKPMARNVTLVNNTNPDFVNNFYPHYPEAYLGFRLTNSKTSYQFSWNLTYPLFNSSSNSTAYYIEPKWGYFSILSVSYYMPLASYVNNISYTINNPVLWVSPNA